MESYLLLLIPLVVVGVLTFMALYRRRSMPRQTALETYIDGLRYLTTGDEQTAFIKLRQAVDQDTDNIDAYLKMGDIFRNRGLVEKALQVHRELKLRHNLPPDVEIEIEKSLAQDFIKAGLKDKAYETLEKMTKNSSSRAWAGERLLDLYVKDKRWHDACELYEDVFKKTSRTDGFSLAGLKIMLGRTLQDDEEYHKARIVYKEALSLEKANPLPYLYIAESYIEEKRIEDGLEFLKRLCEESPRYAYLGFPMLEETLFQLGRYGEVEDIYRNLLTLDVANVPAKIALAGILKKKGDLASAEGLLRSVLELDPSNSLAALRFISVAAARNRLDDGLSTLSNLSDRVYSQSLELRCQKCGKYLPRPLPACLHCGALRTFD